MTLSPTILIKGAGEMASAIAWRLHRANMPRIAMRELAAPLCVRRTVAFCDALYGAAVSVEGIEAVATITPATVEAAWSAGRIAVVPVDDGAAAPYPRPDVVIDAILAKRNLATRRNEAPLVVALGPGFTAGIDCHYVIETQRGHDLGRILEAGSAMPNTGIPGEIAGFDVERVLRAPCAGTFESQRAIGDSVVKGEPVAMVSGEPVVAAISGVLRGLIRPGTQVTAGLKVGDIDPRGRREHCWTISDKARAIAGSVLEAVMRHANAPAPKC